jgi:ribonuclease-3
VQELFAVSDRTHSHSLSHLQERIGYHFRDPALLELAVTHPSFLQENPQLSDSNQRLEFLGDAVLQLALAETVFRLFPSEREGGLSKSRSALARGATLSELARAIGLDQCLKLSASEEQTGGRSRAGALEDAFEALVGAIYLDSDWTTVHRVVLALYGSIEERLAAVQPAENPKGQLQELVQPKYGNSALRYIVTHISGEDHAREYEAQVLFNEKPVGAGRGTSKKIAEEAAARAALESLKDQGI